MTYVARFVLAILIFTNFTVVPTTSLPLYFNATSLSTSGMDACCCLPGQCKCPPVEGSCCTPKKTTHQEITAFTPTLKSSPCMPNDTQSLISIALKAVILCMPTPQVSKNSHMQCLQLTDWQFQRDIFYPIFHPPESA